MKRSSAGALLVATALMLTGCATSTGHPVHRASQPAETDGMSSGMVMPDGSTMGAASRSVGAAVDDGSSKADGPSKAALMICSPEIRTDVADILGLKTTPTATSTWHSHRYTCTYQLPMGRLIVSVQESKGPAAAKSQFGAGRASLAGARKLDGLGEASYGATAGTVVLVKDNDVLTVDTTRLPGVFGSQQSHRFDFAYELASDILGCWTED